MRQWQDAQFFALDFNRLRRAVAIPLGIFSQVTKIHLHGKAEILPDGHVPQKDQRVRFGLENLGGDLAAPLAIAGNGTESPWIKMYPTRQLLFFLKESLREDSDEEEDMFGGKMEPDEVGPCIIRKHLDFL